MAMNKLIENLTIQPARFSKGQRIFQVSFVIVVSQILIQVLQASLGALLQQTSATSATALIGVFYRVHQEGMQMILTGRNILLEGPAASIQCFIWLLVGFGVLLVRKRPGFQDSVCGMVRTLVFAYVANTVRITLLATGVAFPNLAGGLDVMAHPVYELIWFGSWLFCGVLPLWSWARKIRSVPSGNIGW